MIFFVGCFALIALISSRCFYLARVRGRTPPADRRMDEYQEFEKVVAELIEASATSREDAQQRMAQFYKDHPPPKPEVGNA